MTAHSSSIVDFLNARLAEDEQSALATTPVPVAGEWRAVRDKHAEDDAPLTLMQGQDEYGPPYDDYSYGVPVIAIATGEQDEAEANLRHIERWCPARTLRAVETKRRIMALHVLDDEGVYDADGIERPGKECVTCFAEDWPCLTLRLLTLEFQDHKDYRTDWAR